LANVLVGHESLVGPRAVLPETADLMSPAQRRRFDVRPGVTGWAQINGRNDIPWSKRITLDLWYIDHFSLWLDLKILLRSVLVVLRRTGLRQDQSIDTVYDFDPR
jgi:lipopolysaccharide/colanic/teichoic acid biosynthesis glycosyltransferase